MRGGFNYQLGVIFLLEAELKILNLGGTQWTSSTYNVACFRSGPVIGA